MCEAIINYEMPALLNNNKMYKNTPIVIGAQEDEYRKDVWVKNILLCFAPTK